MGRGINYLVRPVRTDPQLATDPAIREEIVMPQNLVMATELGASWKVAFVSELQLARKKERFTPILKEALGIVQSRKVARESIHRPRLLSTLAATSLERALEHCLA
jgi:hypothetical protein